MGLTCHSATEPPKMLSHRKRPFAYSTPFSPAHSAKNVAAVLANDGFLRQPTDFRRQTALFNSNIAVGFSPARSMRRMLPPCGPGTASCTDCTNKSTRNHKSA